MTDRGALIKWVCSKCRSDSVVSAAYAVWDVEKQEWVLDNIVDHHDTDFCYTCSTHGVVLEAIEVSDLKLVAKHVIKENPT